MTKYTKNYNPTQTPQSEQADPRQVRNSAGGYTFTLDKWGQLRRFLVLGSEGGTYYASERKLTQENAKNVEACVREDGRRTVDTIVEVSSKGLAPKNDPAVFALALAASVGDASTKAYALSKLPEVCRIGTHLFQFVSSCDEWRGWGSGFRKAISDWYTSKGPDKAAYQIVKYQNREGWSHRDVLRKAHVHTDDKGMNATFRWATHGASYEGKELPRGRVLETIDPTNVPRIISAYERMKSADTVTQVVGLIREFNMTHEMVPNQWKDKVEVWESLAERMPITATIRNLGKMTSIGLIADGSKVESQVIDRLRNEKAIVEGRVHPIAFLNAMKVYAQGRGLKGSLTWSPTRRVIDALDDGFYMAFKAVKPTGKRIMLALDVSGSMGWNNIAGMAFTPRVGAAAMALVTMKTEPNWMCKAFTTTLENLSISPRQRLDDVVRATEALDFGGTDCALPMTWAIKNNSDLDAIVVYTDNETWAGRVHPHQELKRYRQKVGHDVKLIVVGMTATNFTIADPTDSSMLDVVGFDSSAPSVMSDFISGNI